MLRLGSIVWEDEHRVGGVIEEETRQLYLTDLLFKLKKININKNCLINSQEIYSV